MKELISTQYAPKAIGPYSQAVKTSGPFLFTAGQLGLDPQTGEFVSDNVSEQTEQALKNLGEILKAGGSSYASVIKTTVFLKNMNDFATVNEIYAQFFGKSLPARSAVEVVRLPKDALVEIEAIAVVGE